MSFQHTGRMYSSILILSLILAFAPMIYYVYATPSWPSSWIQVDWDKNENGSGDDWRDVEYAYYNFDSDYLYLRLECYAAPGSEWPSEGARYKWFIDLDGNLYISGGNVIEGEYLLFVEDTDDDGSGELYLLVDGNNNGDFEEYEPWPPGNYANYKITDPNIGSFTITGVFIDMYISWSSLGNPSSYGLYWATDQENPNLNQAPTTDSRDEETAIKVHDVLAVSQVANVTEVTQGEIVEINVTVQNLGMPIESFNVTCYFYPTIVGTQSVTDLAAGQSETLTFYWNTSLVEPGTYEIRAFADSAGEILEINETNNWCTAEATVIVNPAPKHDVDAIEQVANVTIVQQGGIVQINVTVANLGDFDESFDVTCYYDNTPIDTQSVTGLGAGQSETLTFYWDTTGAAQGTYFITAMADSGHEITELNEANNNCTSALPITVYVPIPEGILTVYKALDRVVEGPDPAIANYTTTYEIMITVANIGGSNITNVMVNDTIYSGVTYVGMGTPSKGTAVYDGSKIVWNVTTLQPFEYATLEFNVSLTPNHSGIFILNRGADLIAEGINATGYEVRDSGDIDLTVQVYTRDVKAVSQTPTKTEVIQGEVIGIDVGVENLGDYFYETFNVTCYYNGTKIDTLRIYGQEPGNITTLRFIWDTSGIPTGTYIINATADVDEEISESNEENNNCTSVTAVTIAKIVIHDIAVVSQIPYPTEVFQGETVTINVMVKNEGTETESFELKCYYYGELECCQGINVTDLLPGENRTLTFVWNTTGFSPGIYYVEARALPVEGELDTDDNACTSTAIVIIQAPPVGGEIVNVFASYAIMAIVIAAMIATLSLTIILRKKNWKNLIGGRFGYRLYSFNKR